MTRANHWIRLAALAAATVGSVAAQATFTPLGPGTYAWSMSGDGSIVVGFLNETPTGGPCFRWTAAAGTVTIGSPSWQCSISHDGTTIVGSTADSGGLITAAIWQGGTNWRSIGSLSDFVASYGKKSEPHGLSGDGSVIVGISWLADGTARAFRWDQNGMRDLGSLQNFQTRADAISANGNVIGGYDALVKQTADGPTAGELPGARSYWMGALWPSGQPEGLMHPFGWTGRVTALNTVGSVAAGFGHPMNQSHPYRYTAWDGKVEDLGTLVRWNPNNPPADNLEDTATPNAMTDDGSVIVGNSGFGSPGFPQEGFIWMDGGKIQRLKDYLIGQGVPVPADWQIVNGAAISGDGKVIAGTGLNSQGRAEAFVAKLP